MSKLFTNMDGDNYGIVGHLIMEDGREFIWVCAEGAPYRQILIDNGSASLVGIIPGDIPDDISDILRTTKAGEEPEVYDILQRDSAEIA